LATTTSNKHKEEGLQEEKSCPSQKLALSYQSKTIKFCCSIFLPHFGGRLPHATISITAAVAAPAATLIATLYALAAALAAAVIVAAAACACCCCLACAGTCCLGAGCFAAAPFATEVLLFAQLSLLAWKNRVHC
jgi:hypothetical protein